MTKDFSQDTFHNDDEDINSGSYQSEDETSSMGVEDVDKHSSSEDFQLSSGELDSDTSLLEDDFSSTPYSSYVASSNTLFNQDDSDEEEIIEKSGDSKSKSRKIVALTAASILVAAGLGFLGYSITTNNGSPSTLPTPHSETNTFGAIQSTDTSSSTPQDTPSVAPSSPAQGDPTAQLVAVQSSLKKLEEENKKLSEENESLKATTSRRASTTTKTETVTETPEVRTVTRTLPPQTVTRTEQAPVVTSVRTHTVTATQRVTGPRTTITTTVIERIDNG